MNLERVDEAAEMILAIDTTSAERSIAVARPDGLLAEFGIRTAQPPSQAVHEEIRWLLKCVRIEWKQIRLIAACAGPGSFTGLRVSVATAKGMAQALGVPLAPVSALAATAHRSGLSGTLGVIRDALRGDVYTQRFQATARGGILTLGEPELSSWEEGWASLGSSCDWIIDGLPVQHPPLETEGKAARVYRLPVPFLAASTAVLGWTAFNEGRQSAAEQVDGLYVRASDAEIHRRHKPGE